MTNTTPHTPTPANTNDDPFASAESCLDWLYLLRRELLQIDPQTMSMTWRRERQVMLRKFKEAEQLVLDAIPPH